MTSSSETSGSGDIVRTLELLWDTGRRPSRGPKPALSLDRIVEAAVQVADADGLEAVSMRRVATELGTGAMSLYRYVPGKGELLDLMLDRVQRPSENPADLGDGGWRAALEGLGHATLAAVMAKRIEVLMSGRDADDDLPKSERHPAHNAPPVVITGTEGMSVQLSACCRPIPGDAIMGYIGIGLGMAIHTTDCRVAQRIHRRDPGRWIDVEWAPQPGRLFDVTVKALVKNAKGIFARVAADITSADANIVHIAMDEDLTHESTVLRFVIQVSDRVHLANVMRRVRTNPDVMRIMRERSTDDSVHARHDGGMRIERERQDY